MKASNTSVLRFLVFLLRRAEIEVERREEEEGVVDGWRQRMKKIDTSREREGERDKYRHRQRERVSERGRERERGRAAAAASPRKNKRTAKKKKQKKNCVFQQVTAADDEPQRFYFLLSFLGVP